MAITYVGGVQGGRAGATNTTTQSISGTLANGSNSSPSEGDLVVVLCAAGADTTAAGTQSVSGNTSGAYTGLTAQSQLGTTYDSYHLVSYQFMGATPDTTITIPSSGSIRNAQRWIVHVFRGVDSTTPMDATATYAKGTATGRPNPAAITPVTSGAWIMAFYTSAAATGTAYTAPTDFATDWLGGTTVDTADCMTGAGYYTGWTSGSYDPAAITAGGTTNAADAWTATTVALRPQLTFAPDQTAFRFYEDGTETGSTAIAAQDTNITRNVDADSNLQLRVRVQETGGAAGVGTDDYKLQFNLNAGGWTDVGSGAVTNFASANITDGNATTNRLGAGTGSFVAGEICEDGTVDDLQLTGSNYTELLYSITLNSASLAADDDIDFRVLINGSTMAYTVTPQITADKLVIKSGTDSTEMTGVYTVKTGSEGATERDNFERDGGQEVPNNSSSVLGARVGTVGSSTVTYSDDIVRVTGTISLEFNTVNGTDFSGFIVDIGGQQTASYFSGYLYIPSAFGNPTSLLALISAYDVGGSPVTTMQVALTTGGQLSLRESNTTLRGTALDIPRDEWFRVEVGLSGGNTMELRVFYGANLHTTTASVSSTYASLPSTNIDQWRFGQLTSPGEQAIVYWDDVGYNNTTWPGPVLDGTAINVSIDRDDSTEITGTDKSLNDPPLLVNATWEGGTDGVTIATTDDFPSGDTPVTTVDNPGNGSVIEYDDDIFLHGTKSMRIVHPSDLQWTNVRWNNFGSHATLYARGYMRLTATPAGTLVFFRFYNGTTLAASIAVTGANKLQLRYGPSNSLAYTGTTSVPTDGSWFRWEFKLVADTTNGHVSAKLFQGSNLETSTATETIGNDVDNWAVGVTSINTIRYGSTDGTATGEVYNHDSFGLSSEDWVGSAAPAEGATEISGSDTTEITGTSATTEFAKEASDSTEVTGTSTSTEFAKDASDSTVITGTDTSTEFAKDASDSTLITGTSTATEFAKDSADSTLITGVEGPGTGDNADESEDFESGTNGNSIGTTDLIFDGGSDTGSATWTYSNTRSTSGSLSAEVDVPISGSTYRDIDFSGSGVTLAHLRSYVYVPTVNVAGGNLILFAAFTAGGVQAARLVINTSEDIRMNNGLTGVGTGVAYPFDKWVRVEWRLDRDNSEQTFRLFYDGNLHGTTPDFEETSTFDDETSIGIFRIGSSAGTLTVATETFYDDLGWKLTDWCGPAGGATAGEVVILDATIDKSGTDSTEITGTDASTEFAKDTDDSTLVTGTDASTEFAKDATDSTLVTVTSTSTEFAKDASDSTLITGTDASTEFAKDAADSTLVTGTDASTEFAKDSADSTLVTGTDASTEFAKDASDSTLVTGTSTTTEFAKDASDSTQITGIDASTEFSRDSTDSTLVTGTDTSTEFAKDTSDSTEIYINPWLFTDDFERADGPVGNGWINWAGDGGASSISSGVASLIGYGLAQRVPSSRTYHGSFVSGSAFDSVILTHSLGYSGSDKVEIWSDVGTVRILVANVGFVNEGTAWEIGDLVEWEIDLDTKVRVWVNGTLQAELSNSNYDTLPSFPYNLGSSPMVALYGSFDSVTFGHGLRDGSDWIYGENYSLLVDATGSDTTEVTTTEAYQFATVDVAGSDSTEVTVTESTDLFNDLPGSDQTQITGTSATVDIVISGEVPIIGSDTTEITITSNTTNFDKASGDTTEITGTSAATEFAKDASDSTQITGADASTEFAKDASDATLVTGTDASTDFAKTTDDSTLVTGTSTSTEFSKDATDSTEITGTSTSTEFAKDATDSTQITGDSVTIDFSKSASDATEITGTEAYQFATVDVTGTDSTQIDVTESTDLFNNLPGSDQTQITGTSETVDIVISGEVPVSSADSTELVVTSDSINFDKSTSDTAEITGTSVTTEFAKTADDSTIVTGTSTTTEFAKTADDSTAITGISDTTDFAKTTSDTTEITGTSLSTEFTKDATDSTEITGTSASTEFAKSTDDSTVLTGASNSTNFDKSSSDSTEITGVDASTEFAKDAADSTIITVMEVADAIPELPGNDSTQLTVDEVGTWEDISTGMAYIDGTETTEITSTDSGQVNYVELSGADTTEITVSESYQFGTQDISGSDSTELSAAEAYAFETVIVNGVDIDNVISVTESYEFDTVSVSGSDSTEITLVDTTSNMDKSASDSTVITGTDATVSVEAWVSGSDTTEISSAESYAFEIVDVTSSDATLITGTSVSLSSNLTPGDDTTTLTVDEVSDIVASGSDSKDGSDSTEISSTDTGEITAIELDSTDSTEIAISESYAFETVSVSGTDSVELSTAETFEFADVSVSGSDNSEISISEEYQFSDVEVSGADSTDIESDETSLADSGGADGADSTELSMDETSVIDVALETDDSTLIETAEAFEFDTVSVTSAEEVEIVGTTNGAVYNELPGTDQTDIGSSEASDIEITGQIDISASDSTDISSEEAYDIEITGTVEYSGSDDTDISLDSNSEVIVDVSGSDSTSIVGVEQYAFGLLSISSSDETFAFFQTTFDFGPVDVTHDDETEISVEEDDTVTDVREGSDSVEIDSSETSEASILTFLEYTGSDTTEVTGTDASENLLGIESSDETLIEPDDQSSILAANPNEISTDVTTSSGGISETVVSRGNRTYTEMETRGVKWTD